MHQPLAYSYIRFSSAEQAKGHSKERQTELCRAYCARERLKLSPDVFFDEGVSGWTGDHLEGELGRFIGLVNAGDITAGSYLLVENLDRLSRLQVEDAFVLLADLLRKGITVVTLAPEQVYKKNGDVSAVLSAVLEMYRSNSESSQKGRRLSEVFAKKRDSAKEGLPMGDVAPGWLRLSEDRRTFLVEPQRAEAVRRIFELTIAGYGKNTIAKMLNAEGHPVLSKRKTVKGWSTSAVHHVVMNRSVLGEWQPMTKTLDPKRETRTKAGSMIPDYFPQVIAEDVFLQAQHAIASRRRDRVTRQAGRFNVWSKVAKCIHCGSAMHLVNKGKPPKGQTYLTCWLGRKGLCESSKLIRLDHSEAIFSLMLPRLSLLQLVKDSGARLATRLAVLEAKITEVEETYEEKKMVFETVRSVDVAQSLEKSRVELADLQSQRQAVKADLAAEDAIGFAAFMERLDLESRDFRERTNAALRDLGVVVFVGRDGFVVSEGGSIKFGLAYRDGQAGYLELSRPLKAPPKETPLHVLAGRALRGAGGTYHRILPQEAGAMAYVREETADQLRYRAIEDEGQPITDIEIAAISTPHEPFPPGTVVRGRYYPVDDLSDEGRPAEEMFVFRRTTVPPRKKATKPKARG